MAGTDETPRSRGRPYDLSRDAIILDTVVQMIAERGSLDFSIAELVHRAKVSTATVYRRWPNREALILDALGAVFGTSAQPDRGDAAAEVLETLERWRTAMSSPLFAVAVPVVMAETIRGSEVGRRFAMRHFTPLRDDVAEIYRRAVARGQFRDVMDQNVFVDLLLGPMLRYLAETGEPLTRKQVLQIADTVVNGLAVRHDDERGVETDAPGPTATEPAE